MPPTPMTEYTPSRFPELVQSPRRLRASRHVQSLRSANLTSAHYFVLGTLTAVVTIRFFTEELHVLPRAGNFIDVPLLVLLGAAAAVKRTTGRPVQTSTFFPLVVLFLALTTISTLINLQRVDVFPALAFVYGFLGPPAYYLAVYRLWEPGRARIASRLLVAIASIQFVTIAFFDIPQFVRSRNPDDISGTFGTNAYQLVFFLLWFVALLAGIVTYEPRSRVRFIAIPFIGLAYLAIFLAQYRTLLLTTALATLFIGVLVIKRSRGFFIAAVAAVGLLASLLFIVVYVPTNKFTQAIDAIHTNPGYFVSSRVDPTIDVYHLYGDDPAYVVVGTGPGTYSSRGFTTFAFLNSTSAADVTGPYARRLMGGHPYTTDVSEKYVTPRLNSAPTYGSHAFSNPFSSYLALLAEVGVLAFALLMWMYIAAFARSVRAAMQLARNAVPGDPLPALVIATATAFFVLFQMALFGNWLDTARVTVPTWILFAITVRELTARDEFRTFPH